MRQGTLVIRPYIGGGTVAEKRFCATVAHPKSRATAVRVDSINEHTARSEAIELAAEKGINVTEEVRLS